MTARYALGPALCAMPLVALAQGKDQGGDGGQGISELDELTLLLAGVVAVVAIVLWLARRRSGGGASATAQMRVLGGVAVGNRERVVLVEVGDTQLVLGVAPGRVQTLHVLEEPLELTRRRDSTAGRQAQNAPISRFRKIRQDGENE